MSKAKIILIVVAVAGLALYGFLRQGGDEYAEREVGLDSKEARAALAMFRKLAKSTNHLAQFMSPKANPIAKRMLHQRARQLSESTEVTLKQAAWFGDFLRVEILGVTKAGDTNSHWFLLTEDEGGELRLMGVQN